MFVSEYLTETIKIAALLEHTESYKIERFVKWLYNTKLNLGRVFLLGIGGSAANCSHFANDLRKICGIDAIVPTDNVAELSARVNDEKDGFVTYFVNYLKISNFCINDAVFVMSVSGHASPSFTSQNLVRAVSYADNQNGAVMGIIGNPDGALVKCYKDNMIQVPVLPGRPNLYGHAEDFQSIIWHSICNHPIWKENE